MGVDTVPTGISTGVSGSLLGSPVANSVPANGVLVLAAGSYSLYALGAVGVPLGDHYCYDIGGDIVVQILTSQGDWKTVSVGSLVSSDGANVRFFNGGLAIQSITTQKIG